MENYVFLIVDATQNNFGKFIHEPTEMRMVACLLLYVVGYLKKKPQFELNGFWLLWFYLLIKAKH